MVVDYPPRQKSRRFSPVLCAHCVEILYWKHACLTYEHLRKTCACSDWTPYILLHLSQYKAVNNGAIRIWHSLLYSEARLKLNLILWSWHLYAYYASLFMLKVLYRSWQCLVLKLNAKY